MRPELGTGSTAVKTKKRKSKKPPDRRPKTQKQKPARPPPHRRPKTQKAKSRPAAARPPPNRRPKTQKAKSRPAAAQPPPDRRPKTQKAKSRPAAARPPPQHAKSKKPPGLLSRAFWRDSFLRFDAHRCDDERTWNVQGKGISILLCPILLRTLRSGYVSMHTQEMDDSIGGSKALQA